MLLWLLDDRDKFLDNRDFPPDFIPYWENEKIETAGGVPYYWASEESPFGWVYVGY